VVRLYSKEMVARRLIPLVMALAVALGPTALDACEAFCLSHSGAAAVGSVHHDHSQATTASAMPAWHVHHHPIGTQAAPSGAAIVAQAHPCDHGDELPALWAALNTPLLGPSALVSSFELPQIHPGPQRAFASVPRARSERIVLATQLRV